jgi:hypothetical protein
VGTRQGNRARAECPAGWPCSAGSGGRGLRRIQTGRVQNYALGIALGLIVMTILYLAVAG